MLSIMIVTAALLAQAEAQLPRGVEVDYLEEGDLTVASRYLGSFTSDADTHILSVNAFHEGRNPRTVKEVFLRIYRAGPRWEYREKHDFRVSCGKEELELGKVFYEFEEDAEDPDHPCIESFDILVSIQDLQTILERDQDLTVEIGGRESCILHAPTRRKILEFVKAVRSGAY